MKRIFKSFGVLFLFSIVMVGCQEDEPDLEVIVAPSNLQVSIELVGADADNPNGDGSGVVNLTATADNAITYQFVYNGNREAIPSGAKTYSFSTTGVNTYTVAVVAVGTAGMTASTLIDVEVFASYEAPADLLQMLVANDTRTWKIKAEVGGHFGLGPVGGNIAAEWYSAGANEKSATGMYDDRYIFNADGTFTHITNSVNDAAAVDPSGTVFGRVTLIDELGAHSEPVNGADVENYPYDDYSNTWALTAPDGVETLTLGGTAFIGYYTGGNHAYRIFSRTADEMVLTTADGNNEFNWWFILTADEGDTGATEEEETDSVFDELVWSDEFDVDGAPNTANWGYDLGAGGWGNNELQTYTDNAENVIVEGGFLKITAKADGAGGYTSTRLLSQNLQDFTYGRVEIRAKLPEAQGTWPALWMLGSNFETVEWPTCGEIDIMEQTGWDKTKTSAAIHFSGNSAGNAPTSEIENTTSTTEFNNYILEWTDTQIIVSVNEEVFFTQENNDTKPFNGDFFFIMNIAMGGTLGGTVDPAFTESTMEVDYIRMYQ